MGNPNMMPQMPQAPQPGPGGYGPSGGQARGPFRPSGQQPYAPQPQVSQPYAPKYPGQSVPSSTRQGAPGQSLPPYSQTAQRSPWPQQSTMAQRSQAPQRSPWSQRSLQQGQQYSNPNAVATGVAATELQDKRLDLLPSRIVNFVFCITVLLVMFAAAFSNGVGAAGLRSKLILAVVLLIVGAGGIIYMFVKAMPRLRLANETRCGWKVGISGWMTVILIVIVLVAGIVLTSFVASDYSTGPVTETVTYVGSGTFQQSNRSYSRYNSSYHYRTYSSRPRKTGSYCEFRNDSGKKFRISVPNGYEDLIPADLEYGQRVTLTYYPRTGILVPDSAPTLAE